ncbi:unnamed protein product [Mytilus edulis]|uniref:C2H2-type domain-containing protein n=1 Tax=Mytilus edulis TaxID=6550 RepID=A0A8S3V2W5_MYTED|nr:unnamed protein product [Mytilus edulis]
MYEGRFHCHFCLNTYAFVGTLKKHEAKEHNYNSPAVKKDKKKKKEQQDNLLDHLLLIFKLTALHKNLDTAVDMGDGFRSVRSAKYELPIFNKTGKVKYTIGCTHLITMTSGTMPADITERLVANRCINLQGGKNNNMALDEYVELLNRDSKVAATGCQTKDSILSKSKEFPHLINLIKHYDVISEMRTRKGFHHLPSYQKDVEKVAKDLIDIKAFNNSPGRTIKCEELCMDRNPYKNSAKDLSTLIFRHRPRVPFRRLRDRHF